jgi:AhpD family alkylhydroperoxidase
MFRQFPARYADLWLRQSVRPPFFRFSTLNGDPMKERLPYAQLAKEPYNLMLEIEKYLHRSGLENKLLHLVKLRASQINGCAYCIDMHSKDLLAIGDTMQRIYGLNALSESPYYTDRERAALEWTEALTLISATHADDPIFERVRPHFSDKELADLTWAIAAINLWNRMAISMRKIPGDYVSPLKPLS